MTGRVDVDVEGPTTKGEDWSAKMTGAALAADASGQARAAVLSGHTTVTVRVSGLTPGAVRPWKRTEGHFGTTGNPFGSTPVLPPMTVNADGVVAGAATIPQEFDEAKHYQVRVYASISDVATVAVCGDLAD